MRDSTIFILALLKALLCCVLIAAGLASPFVIGYLWFMHRHPPCLLAERTSPDGSLRYEYYRNQTLFCFPGDSGSNDGFVRVIDKSSGKTLSEKKMTSVELNTVYHGH